MWKSGYIPVSGTLSWVQVSTGGRAGPEEKSLRAADSVSPGYQGGRLTGGIRGQGFRESGS